MAKAVFERSHINRKKRRWTAFNPDTSSIYVAEKQFSPRQPLNANLVALLLCKSLVRLDMFAKLNNGLDYLQVFQIEDLDQDLWVIEDGEAITAMLPSDY